MENSFRVSLSVEILAAEDLDEIERDRLIRQLRRELLNLDFDSVETGSARADMPGAKGGGGAAEFLIVTLSNSTVVAGLVALLGSWLTRRKGRRVRITIGKDSLEIDNADPGERAQLINTWIESRGKE